MTTVSAANTQAPRAVAIDQTRNKIYVANLGAGGVCPAELMGDCNPGSITLIDGATNATTLLIDPKANAPRALVVDSVTDRVYVANLGSSNLSVIGGDVIPTTHGSRSSSRGRLVDLQRVTRRGSIAAHPPRPRVHRRRAPRAFRLGRRSL